jgi:G:T-mismatch repair DNA endonuclease (very short patch repair protein)
LFHGHPNLWHKEVDHFGRSLKDLFAKTETKLAKLKSLGYTVLYIWECDFKKRGAFQSVKSICRTFEDKLEY